MSGLDLRPRVVFYPPGGAVVVLVDPTDATHGNVVLPMLGSIPYDLALGFPESTMLLHVPMYGDVSVPLNLMGGSGPSVVTLPMIGDVPYELTLGPPTIPEGGLFTDTLAGSLDYALPLLGIGALVLVLLMFKPSRSW